MVAVPVPSAARSREALIDGVRGFLRVALKACGLYRRAVGFPGDRVPRGPRDPVGRIRAHGAPQTVALGGVNDFVVVKVKPGSRKGPLVETGPDGELTIYVRERAVDGKANAAVTELLATHLRLPRSRIELVAGKTSRLKRFRLT